MLEQLFVPLPELPRAALQLHVHVLELLDLLSLVPRVLREFAPPTLTLLPHLLLLAPQRVHVLRHPA